MEMWNMVLLIFVGIAGALVLISVGVNFWRTNYFQEKIEIKGDKQDVVKSIVNLMYKCFEENTGKKKSIICEQLVVNSTEAILSSDILNYLDLERIDKSKLKADDLGKFAEIIIRYENQIIYVQVVENERIGS